MEPMKPMEPMEPLKPMGSMRPMEMRMGGMHMSMGASEKEDGKAVLHTVRQAGSK